MKAPGLCLYWLTAVQLTPAAEETLLGQDHEKACMNSQEAKNMWKQDSMGAGTSNSTILTSWDKEGVHNSGYSQNNLNLWDFFFCYFVAAALSPITFCSSKHWPSLVTQLVKNMPGDPKDLPEAPLGKGKATYSSILAYRIPRTVQSWGCKESDTTEWLSLSLSFTFKQILKFIFHFIVNATDYGNSLFTQSQRGQEKLDWDEIY